MNQIADDVLGLGVDHLSKSFGSRVALDDISLEVPLGTVLAVIGPSGSGKTTLLRCIAGLEYQNAGRIVFRDPSKDILLQGDSNNQRLCESAKIGMVFQGLNLWPHMTVLQNVTYGLVKVKRMSSKGAVDSAVQALKPMGLVDKIHRYPDSLSGGEAQRVAIARALVMNPLLLLLDEITSALDIERTWEVLEVVQGLAREGRTMVIVTHELGFAHDIATQVAFLDDGKLVEVGATQKFFESPTSPRTQQFLSHAKR